MDRSIITVTGHNKVGIISKISTELAAHNVSILDITQTIRQGIFNMMMIVDTSESDIAFDELRSNLNALADAMGVHILCQKEEIFDKMHRV
ncbi:MAG: ACT domain-containing protein [Bacteroidales bacterium]|nr:ACT domain-containing protein [Bacteroidales bacterium]